MTKRDSKKKFEKNWLEWVVFGVGLVLVVGTLSYLAYDGATASDAPPSIEVRLGEPQRQEHDFVVPVTIINHGGQTAEGVHIAVVLESGGAEIERSEYDVAFLPRLATREGWVAFRTDPRSGQLKPRVLGYEKP